MAQSLQRALAQLESNVKLEVFLQTSFVLLKILHNIISNPDDEKYRRIRRESKVSKLVLVRFRFTSSYIRSKTCRLCLSFSVRAVPKMFSVRSDSRKR